MMQSTLRTLCVVSLAITTATGCRFGPFHVVQGNGNVTQEERTVGDFHSIDARGFMNVYLTQGTSSQVKLEGESNILPYIETRIEDGKLVVGTLHNININTSHDLNVYVTVSQLREVTLSGSGNIIGKTPLSSTDGIKFVLAGSGDIKADVDAPDLESTLAGSGKIELKGQTRHLKVEIAGSADFKSEDLKSETAEVTIMGSGSAYLFASVSLGVTIGGSGDVYYKGDPALTSKVFGSGTLKKD